MWARDGRQGVIREARGGVRGAGHLGVGRQEGLLVAEGGGQRGRLAGGAEGSVASVDCRRRGARRRRPPRRVREGVRPRARGVRRRLAGRAGRGIRLVRIPLVQRRRLALGLVGRRRAIPQMGGQDLLFPGGALRLTQGARGEVGLGARGRLLFASRALRPGS